VVLSAPSASMTIVFIVTIGILCIGGFLHKLALGMTEPSASIVTAIYYIIPHFELFNMNDLIVHDWPIVPWLDVLLATIYGFAYMAFFLVGACLVFRQKPLN
jgi:hypothetical protein